MKAQNSLSLCDHLGTNLSVQSSRSGGKVSNQTCQAVGISEVKAESDVRWDENVQGGKSEGVVLCEIV